MKKIVALLLATVLMASLLSGCGGGTQEAAGEASKPVAEEKQDAASVESGSQETESKDMWVIDIMADTTPLVDSSLDTVVGQKVAEDFGIGFNYITYPGTFTEKQALMLASGDYGEIAFMNQLDMVKKYIDGGALINLDDYKDLLPNFYKRFEKSIPYWRASAKDGGLYYWDSGVPLTTNALLPHYDIMVRSDVLEYYGYPNLVTASDWTAFIEQALKDFPETYDGQETVGITVPMAEAYGVHLVPIAFAKGDTYVECANDYYTYNNKTEQFEDYMLTPEVKESIKVFNDFYSKGLLDEECFTDLGDGTVSKMSDGRAICVWYTSFFAPGANATLEADGHPEMQYIEMPFQLDSQKGQKYTTAAYYSHPYSAYGISKNCSDPERFVKFLDWVCSEEGQLLLQSGIEGVHYTVENGERIPTDLRKECSMDVEVGNREGLRDRDYFIWRGLPMDLGDSPDGKPYSLANIQSYLDQFSLTERQKEAYNGLGWSSSAQWWEDNFEGIDPGFYQACALPVDSDLGKVGAKMTELRTKYTAKLIMSDDFESTWQELMSEYDMLDHESVINEMNKTIKEMQAALN